MDLIWLKNKLVLEESRIEPRPLSDAPALLLSAAVTALVFAALVFVLLSPDRSFNDFCCSWAAARTAGPGVYDVARQQATQRTGCPLVQSNRYIRPPFYALMLWPLGRLPFPTANLL